MSILTPEQCRAARAWLDWKQEDLAAKAGVSLSTVRDFEKGRRHPLAANLKAIAEALAGGGLAMRFTPDGAPLAVERVGPRKQSEKTDP